LPSTYLNIVSVINKRISHIGKP